MRGAVSDALGRGPSLKTDDRVWYPVTGSGEGNQCSFSTAPTEIADGAMEGEAIVPGVGTYCEDSPRLPAATTTVTPSLLAFSIAAAMASQGWFRGAPQTAPVSSAA